MQNKRACLAISREIGIASKFSFFFACIIWFPQKISNTRYLNKKNIRLIFYFGKVLPISPFKCHCDGLLVKSGNLLQTYTKLKSHLESLISLSKVFVAKTGLLLFDNV